MNHSQPKGHFTPNISKLQVVIVCGVVTSEEEVFGISNSKFAGFLVVHLVAGT